MLVGIKILANMFYISDVYDKGLQEYIENGNTKIPKRVDLTVTVLSTCYWPSYRIPKGVELECKLEKPSIAISFFGH